MGIYLPNMEMPREGQMLVIFPDGTSYVCFNGMRERLAQTEAVPVPKHGRLIDADAQIERAKRLNLTTAGVIKALLDTAPAIIEAEEGEEEK